MTELIHNLDRVALSPDVGLDAATSIGTNCYKKQVSYPGKFGHYPKPGEAKFEIVITPELQRHWLQTIKSQIADGVMIPLQTTHEDSGDPTKTGAIGKVIDAIIEPDSKGREGLFFICEVPNEEDVALLTVSCASLYQPPSFTSGTGKTYARPIRHCMVTTKPTIPGLDKWVALSLPEEKETNMDWRAWAISQGINVPEGFTEEQIAELVATELSTLRASATPVAQSIPNYARKLVAGNRASKLTELVTKGIITPAVSTAIGNLFKDGAHVALSLSEDGSVDDVTDPLFDGVTAALSLLPTKSVTPGTATRVPVGAPQDGDKKTMSASSLADRVKKTTPTVGGVIGQ